MTEAELVRRLRAIRYDPRKSRRPLPLKRIAERAGLSRELVYRAILGHMTEATRLALSAAMSTKDDSHNAGSLV